MKTQNIQTRVNFGFIRQDEILKTVLPVSPATFWRMVAAEQFPQPVKLGKRITAWRILDVANWSAAQGIEEKQGGIKKAANFSQQAKLRSSSGQPGSALDCSERVTVTAVTRHSSGKVCEEPSWMPSF